MLGYLVSHPRIECTQPDQRASSERHQNVSVSEVRDAAGELVVELRIYIRSYEDRDGNDAEHH